MSASNLESGRWGDVFGDGDMAAAVINRIVHHGRTVKFHGESHRNTHSLMKQPNNTNRKPDSPNRPERTTKPSRKSDDTVQINLTKCTG